MNELLDRLRTVFADSYQVDEELTGGGMSRLFRATDLALNRQIVIKILPPELTSELMAARFKRESEVTAHLQHPHILPIITAGLKDGLLYYVMPFIPGESLRAKLKRDTRVPVDESVSILREVASALAYAHREGVIHRDIKPENILLQQGHAVLADFGIAAALAGPAHVTGERLTATGISLGTVGYMAPEQTLGGGDIDARADIYSLGVVGHEMLVGSPPFAGRTTQAIIAAHLTQKAPRLDDLDDEIPVPVARAIGKALATWAAGMSATFCEALPDCPQASALLSAPQHGSNTLSFQPPPPLEGYFDASSAASGSFTVGVTYFMNGPASNGWISFAKTQTFPDVSLSSPSARITIRNGVASGKGSLTIPGAALSTWLQAS